MPIQTIKDCDVHGKRVLVRVDLNTPMDDQQRVTDDTRIRAVVPTLRYILDHGGRAILMSHLGRPKGVTDSLRLHPIAARLSELLGTSVQTASDCIGPAVEAQVAALKDGECLVLENVRFYAEEEKNDPNFARALAALGDLYVNDAFGTAHRAHASTEGVTRYLGVCVAGFLMQKELAYLSGTISNPKRPFVVILGGAKVVDKIAVTNRLIEIADTLIIGGAMAYTFLKSQGVAIGKSLLDEGHMTFAGEMIAKAKASGKRLLLPVDHVVADRFDSAANTQTVTRIPEDWRGLDIGPASQKLFIEAIADAGTILWNGPMGVFEMRSFAGGTERVAIAVAEATDRGAVSIIGGGDTAAAVNGFHLESRMSHVSTGGGASLELLEGRELPGVEALRRG